MLKRARELDSILIRFDNGEAKGAAAYYNEGIKEDGAWMPGAVSLGEAQPLSLVADADAPTLAALLGEVNLGLAARVASLETEAEEARKAHALEIQAKDQTAQALQEQAAAREAELQQAGAAAVAALEAAQQERDAALAQAQRLETEVAGLTIDLAAARALAGTLIEEPVPEPEAPADEPVPAE